jgi:hypothetical protein
MTDCVWCPRWHSGDRRQLYVASLLVSLPAALLRCDCTASRVRGVDLKRSRRAGGQAGWRALVAQQDPHSIEVAIFELFLSVQFRNCKSCERAVRSSTETTGPTERNITVIITLQITSWPRQIWTAPLPS